MLAVPIKFAWVSPPWSGNSVRLMYSNTCNTGLPHSETLILYHKLQDVIATL